MRFFGFRDETDMRSALGDRMCDKILGERRNSKAVRVCRRDRGDCAGSMPFLIDGQTVLGFVYWLEPRIQIVDDKIIRNITTDYDSGTNIMTHTVVYRGDTYSWEE